jgi:hypothetical protein
MTKFSRLNVRNGFFSHESLYNDCISKYKKEDLHDDDRVLNERRKTRGNKAAINIRMSQEDYVVARRTKPPGPKRSALNGKRSDKLSIYDEHVLEIVDEYSTARFSSIPPDAQRLWYRQAFSSEIRSAKAIRKDPRNKNNIQRDKRKRPKNHLASYIETVHQELAIFVSTYAHNDRYVWDIMRGVTKGQFPRCVREEVLAHADAAKRTYFTSKKANEVIGSSFVTVIQEHLAVKSDNDSESQSHQDCGVTEYMSLVEGVAKINLRVASQLNGSNGETTGKDDVESPSIVLRGSRSVMFEDGDNRTITFHYDNCTPNECIFYTRRDDHDLNLMEEVLFESGYYSHRMVIYDMSTYAIHEIPVDEFFWCQDGYLYMLDTDVQEIKKEIRAHKEIFFLSTGNYYSFSTGERVGFVTRGCIRGGRKSSSSFSKIMHEAENLAKQGHNAQKIREILQQRHPKTSAKDLAKVAQGVKKSSTPRNVYENCGKKASTHKPRRGEYRQISNGSSQLRSLGMSQPARQYLATITTPHSVPHNNVRVPLGYGSTQAVTIRSSFDVGVSSTGTGFVAFTPSVDSSRDSVQYTTSSYAGAAAITRNTTATTGVSNVVLALPYTSTQLTTIASHNNGSNLMQYRLVAVGATMKYVGSELNRGGIVYSLCHPRNDDISNMSALTLFQNFSETIKYNINSTEEFVVTWHGRNRYQLELIDYNQMSLPFPSDFPACIGSGIPYWDYSTGSASSGGCCFGFIIADAQPSATFTVEITEHWEFSGQNVGLLASPIISDESGISRAHSIAQESQLIHAQQPHLDRTTATVTAIGNVVTGLEPELSMMASAYGGPELGAAVETGINAYKKVQAPINSLISGTVRDVRKLFNF